jgi:hypothetical protein
VGEMAMASGSFYSIGVMRRRVGGGDRSAVVEV